MFSHAIAPVNQSYFPLTADIDDLIICYVLRNEENAISDLLHFSVEDNGES